MQEMEHCIRNCDEMRAADCEKLAESPEGDFRQAQVLLLHCRTVPVLLDGIIPSRNRQ